MFYNLTTIWSLSCLALGLLIFVIVAWRRLDWGAWLVIALSPLYLLKINHWPLTVLEGLLWLWLAVWFIKNSRAGNPGVLREVKNSLSGYSWAALALILGGLSLGILFSVDWRPGAGILKSWFLAPLGFSLVLGSVFKKDEVKKILSALVVSAAAVALVALGYFLTGQLTFDGRLAAFYLSPNHLAMSLAPGFLAALCFLFLAKQLRQKILWVVISCLLAAVLYFTYSYGAWLALAVAISFVLFFFWRARLISNQTMLWIGLGLIFLLGTIFYWQLGGEKLNNFLSSDRSSWQSRVMVWQAASQILKDNWFLGIGPGLFQRYYLDYQRYFPPYLEWAVPQPHNLYFAWWLEAGLLGLVGWLGLIIEFFRQSFKEWLKTKQPLELILMAVMIYCLLHGLVDTPFWKNDLALAWWLIVFLGCRAGRRAD